MFVWLVMCGCPCLLQHSCFSHIGLCCLDVGPAQSLGQQAPVSSRPHPRLADAAKCAPRQRGWPPILCGFVPPIVPSPSELWLFIPGTTLSFCMPGQQILWTSCHCFLPGFMCTFLLVPRRRLESFFLKFVIDLLWLLDILLDVACSLKNEARAIFREPFTLALPNMWFQIFTPCLYR